MKRLILLLAPLALAACSEPAAPSGKPPVPVNPGPPVAPATPPPAYVGRWAASSALCAHGAWVFTERSLATAGEVSCTFAEATPNETGWIVEGACMAQGPAEPATLVLNTTRPGPGRTLAVSGGPFAEAQLLLACPQTSAAPRGGPLGEAAAIDRRIASEAGVARSPVTPYEFKHMLTIGQAWRENDQVIKIAEPVLGAGGVKTGERIYYFRPGQSDPFLLREAEASYAFDKGKLTAVYSLEGAELQIPAARDKAEIERRLMSGARALRMAADG